MKLLDRLNTLTNDASSKEGVVISLYNALGHARTNYTRVSNEYEKQKKSKNESWNRLKGNISL